MLIALMFMLLGCFASTATIFVSLPLLVAGGQYVSDYELGKKSEMDLYIGLMARIQTKPVSLFTWSVSPKMVRPAVKRT